MTALLLCSLLQDPDVERLIRRLNADEIAVRDDAVRGLIEIGEPARAAVEKLLQSDNPEIAARAGAIVRGIDERARLRVVFGDPRTVTVEAKDEPLVDVLKRLRDETGFPFKMRAVPGADRITCSVSEPSPVAALERICAAHGGIRFDPAALIVTRGTPAPYPAAHDGKFSLYMTSIDVNRYHDGSDYTNAEFRLVFDTPVAPLKVTLATTSIVDDRGNPLLEGGGGGLAGAVFDINGEEATPADKSPVRALDQSLLAPAGDATAISFKGTVEIEYEMERDVFGFDNPSESLGRTQTIGNIGVTLTSFSVGGSITVRVAGPGSEFGDIDTLEQWGRIELVTEDDRRLRVDAYLSEYEEGNETIVATLEGGSGVGAGVKIKRIEAIRTRSTHRVSIPFEFKDIKIR